MIEFDDAAFRYDQTVILRKISLTVEPGSFLFLTGGSGSGKSTFVRLCHGDLAPTLGRVLFGGVPLPAQDRDAVADLRRKIGVVHQVNSFIDHISLLENIALPLTVGGVDPQERSEDLDALLDWVGLKRKSQAKPPELSGGERQRAAVARSVILGPELIIADEPTGGVDWDMAMQVLALFVELNRMGRTVVIATHDIDLVRAVRGQVDADVLQLLDGSLQKMDLLQ